MPKSLDFIRSFGRLPNLQSNEPLTEEYKVSNQPNEDIYKIVFAPNPVTGCPSSDISFALNNNQSEDFKQFVRNTLLVPRQVSSGIDSADTALDFVVPRSSSGFAEFKAKLTDYVNNLKSAKDNKK